MHDLRTAWRRLARTPGATLAMASTLALGIAAVTAAFAVTNAVALRPLPFPGSERAVVLCETAPRLDGFCVASPPNIADWERASRSIERFGAAREWPFRVRAGGEPLPLDGGIATPGYLEVAGARAALGRLLRESDLEPGGTLAVVLADEAWRRHFAADPSVVGRRLSVDGREAVVVGVLAADAYTPLLRADAWLPLTATGDDVTNRAWRGFVAVGRLAAGATLEQARREMELVRAGLASSYPASNRDFGLELHRLREHTAGTVRGTLWAFLGAVSCLLLIGCANVAGLMLARAAGRGRELAVRSALGAGRLRLVRETLAEALVLAAVGAALGLVLSWWAVRAFVALAPAGIPRLAEVGVDARALGFGTAASVATVLLFALVPAARASRVELVPALQGGRTTLGGAGRLRRGLVVAQVALALVLLAGAGLLARSLAAALRWDPGFDPRPLAVLWLLAPAEEHRTGASALGALERASDAVRDLPGVKAVGLASAGPLFGGTETAAVGAFGRPAEEAVAARWYDVGPGYLPALGLPLARGRDFAPTDGPSAPPVALVNETLARRLWPGDDPLGRELSVEGERRAVVGVVRDVPPLVQGAAATAELYRPKRQYPRWGTFLVVRSANDPGALEAAIRRRLSAVEPGLELGRFRTLEQARARLLVSPRFALSLAGAFAAAALALAAVGLYAVLAFSVASRTREMGLRLALGQTPRGLALATVIDGLRLVAGGLSLGVLGAIGAERLLRGFVPGLAPAGAATHAAAAVVFLAVALAACLVPARRASRLDPAEALRVD